MRILNLIESEFTEKINVRFYRSAIPPWPITSRLSKVVWSGLALLMPPSCTVLQDPSETGSEKNSNKMFRFDLVEKENVSNVSFFEPKTRWGALGIFTIIIVIIGSDLQLQNIKDSPNWEACPVACTPPRVHITPVPSQLRWLQPKLEFPKNACPCFNAITSPPTPPPPSPPPPAHFCQSAWLSTTVRPFSTTPARYRQIVS